MEIEPGRIVISRAGRDKGKYFIVMGVDGCCAYLADGDLRKVTKPKKKKLKHLEATDIISEVISDKIKANVRITDRELRKLLEPLRLGRNINTEPEITGRGGNDLV